MSGLIADAVFWIAVASCTVAQAAIVRSIVISPTRRAATAAAANADAPSAHKAVELLWAVLPGVALALLFVFTWRAMHGAGVA